ncbi:Spy/CpxP family protein refolding chaperone [Thalassotalea crassostreae]|uniref:Spy/CpxP family protein refolding chaperone n=1 Tax=Thalassotalea crassostreae TaxID=1763536 RepID=UPI000838CBC0|nr:Spy/CpxP family protein refolding chaperone [Thalassotalea crassostreae]
MKKLILVMFTLVCVSFSSVAKDQKGKHRGKMDNPVRMMFSKLDLSEEQKQQVKDIMKAQKEQMKALNDGQDQSKEQMKAIIHADTFDELAFKALQSRQAVKMQKLGLIKAKSMHEMYQVLTAEQKQKMAEMADARKQKMQKKKTERAKKKEQTAI